MKLFANFVLICCACTLLLPLSSSAQKPGSTSPAETAPMEPDLKETTLPSQQAYELRGHEVPLYYCVRMFFRVGHHYLGSGSEKWVSLLKKVGITPGSRAEDSLRSSLLVAAGILSQRGPTPDIGEAQYAEAEYQWGRSQRRVLAAEYNGLRIEMLDEYGSAVNLDGFVRDEICPKVSVSSNEPFGEDQRALDEEFEMLALKGVEQ